MSNPLSSLRKGQKNPYFTGLGDNMADDRPRGRHRTVPVRNPLYSEDEGKLLDEITGGMATSRMRVRDPFTGGLPKLGETHRSTGNTPRIDYVRSDSDLSEASHPPTDHELMSTMMSRITKLEATSAFQAKELQEKERTIKVLQDKVKLLQKARADAGGTDSSAIKDLENKCSLLQQQVYDMENFLSDYGMIWVGEKSNPNSDVYNDSDDTEEEIWRPDSSIAKAVPFTVDYNLVLENIRDLNTLAGDGIASIQSTKDGARLKMPDPVQLTLYANGMVMFSGPFRPFTDPATQHCLQDIMDGYFPAELQKRYPDGVPFQVTDRREVHFEDKRQKVFEGSGQVLGGDTKPSRLVPTKLEDHSTVTEPVNSDVETTSQLPGRQLTMEQFLQKLPKSVVKKGQLIDIRNSVGETLHGGPRGADTVTLVETDTVLDMKERLEGKGSRPYTPRDITTLRVKSDAGDHTYILKMKFNETVGDLRKYIDLQRSSGEPQYDIVSAYPNKQYRDNSLTLEAAGLTPNAVLHLKLRKS